MTGETGYPPIIEILMINAYYIVYYKFTKNVIL